jgi:pimeloyl-ACP methyl ester carboxylesterase
MAPSRGGLAAGLGLVASVAALATGGIAIGIELERRMVSKRIGRNSEADLNEFFSLRSSGPDVITPDGVVLHTEVDEGPAEDFTLLFVHGYGLNLDCWHFQRLHFCGQLRQVFYDQRSHGRSSRSEADLCRIPQLADDLLQILQEVIPSCSAPGFSASRCCARLPERSRITRQFGAFLVAPSTELPSRYWPASTAYLNSSLRAGGRAVILVMW